VRVALPGRRFAVPAGRETLGVVKGSWRLDGHLALRARDGHAGIDRAGCGLIIEVFPLLEFVSPDQLNPEC
jgi:hypothetical protein